MTATANTTVNHQATVTFNTLPPATRTYTSNFTSTVDSWTASAGVTVANPLVPAVLAIDASGAAGTTYAARAVTTVAGTDVLRVRAMVRLADPTARPCKVWVTDQAGNGGTQAAARFVGAAYVEVTADLPIATATSVRLNVAKPTGATSSAVWVSSVTFDRTAGNGCTWSIDRTDNNGTTRLASHLTHTPSSAGVLTLVDRTASLRGNVTWSSSITNPPAGATSESVTVPLADSGNAVITALTSGTLFEGALIGWRMTREGASTMHDVINRSDPLAALAPMKSRTGSLTFRLASDVAAHQLADACAVGQVLMLRDPLRDRVDMYFVPERVDLAPVLELTTMPWDVTVTCTETAPA